MKKRFLSLLLVAVFTATLYAQRDDAVQQILIPKEVFVGDSAELRYSFRSAVDFFDGADSLRISGDTLILETSQKAFSSLGERCSISRAILERSGLDYTLRIIFVPWMPGTIDFPPLDLDLAVYGKQNTIAGKRDIPADAHFFIDLEPVTVASLSEKLGVTTLRKPISPLSVPGTNYLVLLLIIVALIALGLLVFFFIKLPTTLKKYQLLKEEIGFYKNAHATVKKYKRLAKSDVDDKEFALCWQTIMRSYLEYRFSTSLSALASSRVVAHIEMLTGGLLSSEQQNVVEQIASFFHRTDYIRFAGGSLDAELLPAQEHQAAFLPGERESIIQETQNAIVIFEKKNLPEDKTK